MERLFKITYNVVIERLSNFNYEISVIDWDNKFYILASLKKISNNGNLRNFLKELAYYLKYDNKKPVIFERKDKLYYYKDKKIKEVDKKWEKLLQPLQQ